MVEVVFKKIGYKVTLLYNTQMPEYNELGQEILKREWLILQDEDYAEVMGGERYHDHRIIKTDHGTYRWEKDEAREQEIMDHFGITDLNNLTASKNDPLVREMYRCMGYSVFGYWEVFYWEVNNEEAGEWDASEWDDFGFR